MSTQLRHLCAAAILAAWSSACVFALGTEGDDHSKKKGPAGELQLADATSGKETDKTGADASDPKAAEAKKKKEERKAEKRAREVTYAKMEMQLAQMDADMDLREATNDVEH